MGPILDLAVIALSVVVCASLALLAWTLGVTGVRAIREERARVDRARTRVASLERELAERAVATDEVLRQLARRFEGDR